MNISDKIKMFLSDAVFLFIAVACATCHVVGMVYPGWWYVSEIGSFNGTEILEYFGIWETVTCTENECVQTMSDMTGKRAWLIGVAVLEVVSAILFLITFIVSIVFTVRSKEVSVLRKLFVVTIGGAGTFVILGILIFIKKKAGLTKVMALETSHGDPGWPLILSAVSGSVAIVTAVAMGIKLCTRVKELDEIYLNDPQYLHEIERKINELKVSVEPYQREKKDRQITTKY